MLKNSALLIGFFCLIAFVGFGQTEEVPPEIDAYVEKVLREFDVPGIGLAIVKDGKIALSKGYGVKRLGSDDPIDGNTLFSIASNSKAFTATALALLVEEGKLNWEDPVVKYLPYFKLSDDYVTSHLTVRDLLVHHSGLPAYANDLLLFPPSTFSRKELLQKLKDVPLSHDFRSVYAYDNILYLAAGEVVEAASGMPWEDFVKARIFNKIGMDRSVSRFSDLKQQSNVAMSHARRQGEVKVIERFFETNIGDNGNPAGGIASSVNDMSKWLITQLDSGRTPDGKRLFKPSSTTELWKEVRPMPVGKEPEWLKPSQKMFHGYALGFRTYDYQGARVVGHGGLLTGFVSQVAMVPEKKIGIVVLTNQLATGAYWSIINHVLDYYLGNAPFDWIGGYKKELERSLARQDSIRSGRALVEKDPSLKNTLPIPGYAGVYENKLIGKVVVRVKDGNNALRLNFLNMPAYIGVLDHFHGDLFRVKYDNADLGEGPFMNFVFNADKSIREIRFVSERRSERAEFDEVVLKPQEESVLDTAGLFSKIREQIEKYPEGNIAYAFMDITDGEQLLHDAKRSFHAASTMKTPVMLELYRQAGKGKFNMRDSIAVVNAFRSIVDKSVYSLPPDTDSEGDLYSRVGSKVTLYDMTYRMITESSNLATNILIDRVGAKNVMKTMNQLGANDIRVLRGVEDLKAFDKGLNNSVTAYDLMLVFEHIAKEAAKQDDLYLEMVSILKDQKFNTIIPGKLPSGVEVAHKTGSIEGIRHDSGIVYLPDGRAYVLVLLSSNLKRPDADEALSQISKLFYNYMDVKEYL